jgi:hypothetical protein
MMMIDIKMLMRWVKERVDIAKCERKRGHIGKRKSKRDRSAIR